MLQNIPLEMQRYKAWVCWRYENVGEKLKPTKVPYNPLTGQRASVTKPDDWCYFNQCVYVVENTNYYSGIGFVLSDNDPYTFIDLDDPEEDENIRRRHEYLFNYFNTYTEFSPSKKGVHIIAQGSVPTGKKKQKIEIYSKHRFMTMTGHALKPTNITNYQEDLMLLWEELGGGTDINNRSVNEGNPQYLTDEEVIHKCMSTTHSSKFSDLWIGNWEYYYPSQSEADLALVNYLVFASENRQQVERLFKQSELGKRPKNDRPDILIRLLDKAFDKLAPAVDFSAIITKNHEKSTQETPILVAESRDEVQVAAQNTGNYYEVMDSLLPPFPIYTPPGLLGDIAASFYESTPRPVYDIALVGAIGFMAGIVGRNFNISDAGLNQYLMVLAETGCGKDTIAIGTNKLIGVLKERVPAVDNFYKSGNIQSAPALIKMLDEQPCFFFVKGEYGQEIKKMTAFNANSHQTDLKQLFLDVFSKSGKTGVLKPLSYSDKSKNTKMVISPALTFICESTPEMVFQNIDENLISDGLLSRFNIMYYKGDRPPRNKDHESYVHSEQLLAKIADIVGYTLKLMNENKFVDVAINEDALQFLDKVDLTCDSLMRVYRGEIITKLLNRVHLKTLKLAALLAVCNDPFKPTVDLSSALWAYNFINSCTKDLMKQFEEGKIGNPSTELRQMSDMSFAIEIYLTYNEATLQNYGSTLKLKQARILPYSYIYKKVSNLASFKQDRAGARSAIAKILTIMVDSGKLTEIPSGYMKQNYGMNSKAYLVN